ncbi:MAG: CopG family transcriptional regulator [Nocardioidaceae bacterium]
MPAIRTQLYLAAEQRRRIDQVAARDGVTLAEVVRRALDRYLEDTGADPTAALDETFGADPQVRPPSRDEWTRG